MTKGKKRSSKFTSTQKCNQNSTNAISGLKWLSLVSFILVALLIFYPPYFRGLFFNSEVFITHVITAIVFIVVWARKVLEKDYSFLQTPIDWAIIAYAGSYLLSLTGAVHISEAIYGFFKVLNYFMIYWLVTQVVKDFRDYEKIIQVLIAGGLGVAIIGILCAAGIYNYPSGYTDGMILSTLQYPNTTAAYLSVLVLLVVTLLNRDDRLPMRIIYAIAGYIMVLVILCTLSKGTWLIFLIGGLLLVLGMPGIKRLRIVCNMAILFLAAILTFARFYPAITGNNRVEAFLYLFLGLIITIMGIAALEGLVYLYRNKGKRVIYISIGIVLLLTVLGISTIGSNTVKVLPDTISTELKGLTDFSDNSYTARYDFIRWGMAMVKDYPLTGTGAGGWNALYHQYQDYLAWTTEAHNHFIQVWVEAGTIGLLAFLSIWFFAVMAVVKLGNKLKASRGSLKDDNWYLVWGTLSAAIALGLHASIDFDLSLAAISILLWVLFALLNSGYKIVVFSTKEPSFRNRLMGLGFAIILLLTLLIGGSGFAIADSNAHKGDLSLKTMEESNNSDVVNREYRQARKHYEKAVAMDSRNAYYKAKLAYTYALEWRSLAETKADASGVVYNNTVALINEAHTLQPFDNDLNNYLVSSISILGNLDLMQRISLATLTANPNDINTYNLYAETLWKGTDYYRNLNKPKKAGNIATELASINDILEEHKQEVNQDASKWQGLPLQLSPNSDLYIARACFLLGDYHIAGEMFSALVTKPELQSSDAAIWYAASLYKSGRKDAAGDLIRNLQLDQGSSYESYQKLIRTKPLL